MTINYQFVHLVEKMSNSDKDIRFMATNDMLTELQKDTFKLRVTAADFEALFIEF